MKVSALYSRVRDRLGEDPNDAQRYTNTLLRELLREAVEMWSVRAGGRIATRVITLVANQIVYTLPRDPVRVISVIESTSNIPLVPASYGDLYRLEGWDWRSVRSNRPTHYSLFSLDEIWLWPALSSVTSEYVTVTYQEAFSTLNTSSTLETTDEIPLPQEFHNSLTDYLTGRCLLIGAKDVDKIERAAESVSRWSKALETIRELRSNRAS